MQPQLAARQEFWLCLQYFKQHGYHVIVFNFGARSHFTFIDSMFCNTSMFIELCNKNNKNNINHQFNVLFIICTADHYYVKIVHKFQCEIRITNVCNSNSNFRTEVQKFELSLTSLIIIHDHHTVCLFSVGLFSETQPKWVSLKRGRQCPVLVRRVTETSSWDADVCHACIVIIHCGTAHLAIPSNIKLYSDVRLPVLVSHTPQTALALLCDLSRDYIPRLRLSPR